MTDFTIVEPYFELFDPCTPVNYMQFLELCTRNCYKSEEYIKIGSAEKLLKKVINDLGHYSVTEHANCIMEFRDNYAVKDILQMIALTVPLMRMSWRDEHEEILLVSGNLRMWWELTERYPPEGRAKCRIAHGIENNLAAIWPFFFNSDNVMENHNIRLLDANPLTNIDGLNHKEMLQHMTMTGRFVGSRSMSHQLVRHRLAAYSQESTRYCNYDKKGFQFIVPPSIHEQDLLEEYVAAMMHTYDEYLTFLSNGLKPEDARFLLPIALKTEVIATYTLDTWAHCIHHRGYNKFSQWEIRSLFQKAEEQIIESLGWNPYEVKYGSNERYDGTKS